MTHLDTENNFLQLRPNPEKMGQENDKHNVTYNRKLSESHVDDEVKTPTLHQENSSDLCQQKNSQKSHTLDKVEANKDKVDQDVKAVKPSLKIKILLEKSGRLPSKDSYERMYKDPLWCGLWKWKKSKKSNI